MIPGTCPPYDTDAYAPVGLTLGPHGPQAKDQHRLHPFWLVLIRRRTGLAVGGQPGPRLAVGQQFPAAAGLKSSGVRRPTWSAGAGWTAEACAARKTRGFLPS